MAPQPKIKLALVGGDSLRGREFKEALARSSWQGVDIEFFDPEVQEEFGKLTDFRDEPRVVRSLKGEDLEGKDLVFSAAEKSQGPALRLLASKFKFRLYDLSEAFNDDPSVPLVVSGVNDRTLDRRKTKILANPNPATVILSHLFHLLEPAYGLAKAVTLVLQPVSAFDDPGIQELASQSAALLSGADPEKKVFKEQIAFNLLSHTEKPDPDGSCTVELQIAAEVKRVLDRPDLPLSLATIQAPVFHTYTLVSYIELVRDADLAGLEALFAGNPIFTMTPFREGCAASPLSVAGKDEIFVGRLKRETAVPRAFWVWLVADNLTRGSALNAVETARRFVGAKAR
ncbi:MAG: Asd/ArgC dimerization domain-containing protein [Candidatus Aminicenantes bacterium]|nr:Asd/ArgC dimerization domain-containing protein [Candidatus Aminicenantes bacterium]